MRTTERLNTLHTNLRNTNATILRLIQRTLIQESLAASISDEIQSINSSRHDYSTHNDPYEQVVRQFELNYWSNYYSLKDRDTALQHLSPERISGNTPVSDLDIELYQLESFEDISYQLDIHHFLELESRTPPNIYDYYRYDGQSHL